MPQLSDIPEWYDGPCRKLVLAFDVGTTFSGVSYSIMNPGTIPQVRGVSSFPGQSEVGGGCKVPSVVLYNRDGSVRAVGSEAKLATDNLDEEDEDEVVEVRRFKLHFAPNSMKSAWISDTSIPALPPGKTAVDVLSVIFEYLYRCARKYIRASEPNGPAILETLEDNIDFILSHPNQWGSQEEADMHRAAITAGLVPDTKEGHVRLHLVTEGVANLHYCLDFVKDFGDFEVDSSVVIIDAGGSTIQCSSYKFTNLSPYSITELAHPGCHLEGSEFVTTRVVTFLNEKFKGSPYVADVDTIASRFDETIKRTFKDSNKAQSIDFGRKGDHQPSLSIIRGKLKLTGAEVDAFFRPSLMGVIDEVKKQQISAHPTHIQTACLVGGFAANDWLFWQLRRELEQYGIKLLRPHLYPKQAVAHGAISSYLNPKTVTRIETQDQLFISPFGEGPPRGAFQRRWVPWMCFAFVSCMLVKIWFRF
ncbi:hypothetical protein JAAARDRAFT_198283 [Jaapia argillacea MUCL 33604]|uniref:Actin-like ATPase domain-containing protein n=1 Tax=Jaapia argillacea MUCL 33604 TaxID=933084 RepID=A0A067PEU4_9AGAM|nr:hypothetical protein JAAARDRAFT_198283 [Jaapia argillacea MUCL 33604]